MKHTNIEICGRRVLSRVGKYLPRSCGNNTSGSSNRKMTSMCQEQTEESGGTENEIGAEAGVHKIVSQL